MAGGREKVPNNDTAALVNSLRVDHPAVIRSVAAERGVPLVGTSVHHATVMNPWGVSTGTGAPQVSPSARRRTCRSRTP